MFRFVSIADAVNWDAPLNGGLLAWYMALPDQQRGIYFRDLCRRVDGTLTNAPLWGGPRGRDGGAGTLSFTAASGQYVDLGNPDLFNLNHMSFASWVFPTSFSDYRWIIGKTSPGTGERNFDFDIEQTTGKLRFFFTSAPSVFKGKVATNALAINKWSHCVATFDGATVSIYTNGVPNGSAAQAFTPQTTGQSASIGRPGTFNGQYFDGYLDDIRVCNRAWSANEVMSLCQASRGSYERELNWQEAYDYVAQEAAAGRTTKNTRSHPLGVRAGINWRVSG